jgi:hypothetical protein
MLKRKIRIGYEDVKLDLQKTLRQRCLKLYGWPSAMAEEPFSTVPVAVFPFPVDARALKHAILHQGPAAGVKV